MMPPLVPLLETLMVDNRQPPPHIAAAAKLVEDWLAAQPPVPGTGVTTAPPPRLETAMQKFARLDRSKPPAEMPAWRDPRSAA